MLISALSVWWVPLGIKPERIQRGKPVGIEYQDDGGCKIHYGPLHLASA